MTRGSTVILAVLPPHKYYRKITINADLIAVRQLSQIGDGAWDNSKLVLFDQFIPKDIAEKFNRQAMLESLNHAKIKGQDLTAYKNISLVDINSIEISCKIFFPSYHEALSFISCIDMLKPSAVYVSRHDEWLSLFKDISEQLGVKLEIYDRLGLISGDITNLLEKSYSRVRDVNFHAPLKLSKSLKYLVSAYNIWSKIVRFIRGDKPFISLAFSNPLKPPMRSKLLLNKKYYPLLHNPILMNLKCLFLSGAKIFPFEDSDGTNKQVEKLTDDYFELLKKHSTNKTIGQINYLEKDISIARTLTKSLKAISLKSFKQIADKIDFWDKVILYNNLKGHFGCCDGPWKMRLVVRLCQKYHIPTSVIINGFCSDNFEIEAKASDLTLCYGESSRENYLKDKLNSVVVGNPLFEKAYKIRKKISINFPPKNILVGSFAFSPININRHYSDNERFILEVFQALKKIKNESKFEFEVSLKLHPADIKDFYKWFVTSKNFRDVEVIAAGDFQKIVSKFDLLIINYSTAIFETALMGIPVIFYHSNNQILFEPYNGFGPLPTAFTTKELENVLERVFHDRDYAHSFNDLKVLERFTGPVDGKSGERILNIITKHLD